jgi:prepilin-type N-terminal cleavage/methylation domain-containing protein
MKKRKTLGFTLIELMVVITIIAILATMGINTFVTAQKKARDSKRMSDARQIMSGIGVTADLSGNLRVLDTAATAICTIDAAGAIAGTCDDTKSSIFKDALGGTWPSFPRGKMASGSDQKYFVSYDLASNTSCICAPLEVANGGNASSTVGCSLTGAVKTGSYIIPPTGGCTAGCDYFCLAI